MKLPSVVIPVGTSLAEAEHQKTSPLSQPSHKPQDRQRRRKYQEADSDSEYMPGENESGGQLGLWSCRLCNIDRFLNQTTFNRHIACVQHCQKYLRHQAFMGFEKFYVEFGAIPFGGKNKDMPDEAVDIMNHMELMIYRSGVINKMECRVCDIKCNTMNVWKQHINGRRHLKKCADEMFKQGREKYLSQLGDIPIPDPDKLQEVLNSLEKESDHSGKKSSYHQQTKSKPIPNLSKTKEQQFQHMESGNRNWRPSQDWGGSASNNPDNGSGQSRAASRRENIVMVSMADNSLLGPHPNTSLPPRTGLLGAPPQQPMQRAIPASQTSIIDAAFKQGAILTQVSQMPVIPGTVPMIRSNVPSGLVMVPAHQIELARAQAQAQGLLPQTQPMPLQEQLEALGPTPVPKKIDVRPTKDLAELHSELQKQLLGAEIIPPSRIEESEKEKHNRTKNSPQKKSRDEYYSYERSRDEIARESSPRRRHDSHYRDDKRREDDEYYKRRKEDHYDDRPNSEARRRNVEKDGRYRDDYRHSDYRHGEDRREHGRSPARKADYKSYGDFDDKDRDRHVRHESRYDERSEHRSKSDHFDRPPRSYSAEHRHDRRDENYSEYYDKEKDKRPRYSAAETEDYWHKDSRDKQEKYPQSDRSYNVREDRKKPERSDRDERRQDKSYDREKDYTDFPAHKDHSDDRIRYDQKYSVSRRRDHDRSDQHREDRSHGRDDRKRDHRGFSRDTVHSREGSSRTRREDSTRRDEKSIEQRHPDHRSRDYDRNRDKNKDSRTDDYHSGREERYDKNQRRSQSRYSEDNVFKSKQESVKDEEEDDDKPRDLREILEESRRTESIGANDLRIKLSQKRLSDSDIEASASQDYDQRLEVEEPIVVEVGGSDNRDTDYRKVYVPHEGTGDEDLRLHIERKHREHHSEGDSYRDRDDRYHHWEEHEEIADNHREDEDWRNHMERQKKYYETGEPRPTERPHRRDQFRTGNDYHTDDYDERREGYYEESVDRRRHQVDDFPEEDERVMGWEGEEVREGGREYKDGDYRRQYYHSDHRDQDDRADYDKEDFGEAGRRARSGLLDEEAKGTSPSRKVDDEMELKGAMEIFSETLQQFIRMLHGTQDDDAEVDDGEDPLLDMSEEEIQAVRQVQEMTGINDMKMAANAMRVFSTMDPMMIQMVGQLGPDNIKELMSGNSSALESLPNFDAIRTGITEGRINPHEMQDTMEKYGFCSRGQPGRYRRGGGRPWRGRGRAGARSDDGYKRGWHGRGRGGPASKRGRY